MRDILQSLRTTLRSLARQPGLTLVVVLTLALGIGASTALFAYLSDILWPRLDAPEPDRVVWVTAGIPEEIQTRLQITHSEYLELQRKQSALRSLIGFSSFGVSFDQEGEATFAWTHAVSGGYFPFFATRPARGRLLQPADDKPGAPPVAVVSHLFWKSVLKGDPGVVGRQARINGQSFTIVGVLPEGFQGYGRATPLYVPLTHVDRVTGLPRSEDPEARWVNVMGRLADGVTLAQAEAATSLTARGLDEELPLSTGPRKFEITLETAYDPEIQDETFVVAARALMAAALLFLLLGCANVANLLLARATTRQREWGIRAALGADRARLIRNLLAESLVLCVLGGIVGMAVAGGLARRIETYLLTSSGGLGDFSESVELVRLDFRTFAFALLAALVCTLLCGLAPAVHVLRGNLFATVKADTAGAVGPAGAMAPRKLLVIAQVGLCVVLVLGGGLLVRTLQSAERTDPGFETDRLLLATLFVPRNVSLEGQKESAVYDRLQREVSTLAGVEAATLSHLTPLAGWTRTVPVTTSERQDTPLEIAYNMVGPDYFGTLGIPVLQGRPLDSRDRLDSPPAVVVNRELARQLWGDANPVGRLLTLGEPPRPDRAGPVFEVVGVAADVRAMSILAPPGPLLYFSQQQRPHARMTLIVRSPESTAALAPVLRNALRKAHPDLSIVELISGDEQKRRSLVQQRMHAEIAALFGLLGLGVAALGLFGLLSYTVSLRVREFGIRMAIGAGRRDVLRLVLRQGMSLVGVGLVLGLAGAFALTRLLAGLLFGVEATDPLTFVGVPAALILVTLVACWLPARRAARLDPLAALRERT